MLHTFTIKNFQSFRERTEVSLRLTRKASSVGWDVTSPTGQRLATALAVVGPNGSGKTSLIKPLAFAGWFIADSFQSQAVNAPIPFKSHFASTSEPMEMEIEADDGTGTLWKYVLHATNERVLHEALYRKNVGFSYVFVRNWDGANEQYEIKQKGFDFAPAEAKKVRANASLISTAAQYGNDIAKRLASTRISTNLWVHGRYPSGLSQAAATHFFHQDEKLRAQMEQLLKSWDLGLSGISIERQPVTVSIAEAVGAAAQPQSQSTFAMFGVHEMADGTRYRLPWAEESNGTQTACLTLWRLLQVLATGGIAVIDELENDMHPHMLEPILDLFADSKTNPHNAQILFTCHTTEILNLLGKSQAILVEKTNCESQAWRLDTMTGVRTQDNLYSKYMSGAYGAVPKL